MHVVVCRPRACRLHAQHAHPHTYRGRDDNTASGAEEDAADDAVDDAEDDDAEDGIEYDAEDCLRFSSLWNSSITLPFRRRRRRRASHRLTLGARSAAGIAFLLFLRRIVMSKRLVNACNHPLLALKLSAAKAPYLSALAVMEVTSLVTAQLQGQGAGGGGGAVHFCHTDHHEHPQVPRAHTKPFSSPLPEINEHVLLGVREQGPNTICHSHGACCFGVLPDLGTRYRFAVGMMRRGEPCSELFLVPGPIAQDRF